MFGNFLLGGEEDKSLTTANSIFSEEIYKLKLVCSISTEVAAKSVTLDSAIFFFII